MKLPLILVLLLAAATAKSQETAQLVACMAPLRDMPQEKFATLNIEDQTSLMVYRAWRASFSTESEAQEKDIDLGIVYDAFKLSGSRSEKFNKYYAKKDELSERFLSFSKDKRLQSIITSVTNVEALKVYAEIIKTCLQSTEAGAGPHCVSSAMGEHTISVSLSKKYEYNQKLLTIDSATAKLVTTGTGIPRDLVLWDQGTPIDPYGITATFTRTPDESATFSIHSNLGLVQCDPVLPKPKYLIVGSFFGTKFRTEIQSTDVRLDTIQHIQCKGVLVPMEDDACAPDGSTVVDLTLSGATALNPYLRNEPKNVSCFRPRIDRWDLVSGKPNCAHVRYSVLECSTLHIIDACDFAVRNGTKFTASVTYRQGKEEPIKPVQFMQNFDGSVARISYFHVNGEGDGANASDLKLKYIATIVNRRAPDDAGVQISSDVPRDEKRGVVSVLDSKLGELLITISTVAQ